MDQRLSKMNGVSYQDGVTEPIQTPWGIPDGAFVTHKRWCFFRQGKVGTGGYGVWYRGNEQLRALKMVVPISPGMQLWPTLEQAWANRLCVRCLCPAIPKCYSKAGHKEVDISGLCEPCFDQLTAF